MSNAISLKNELIRKSIHVFTTIIPLVYYFYLTREQMSVLCISLLILFLVGDILRIYITLLTQIYEKFLGKLLRSEETGKRLNGATLLFLGFTLSVLFFEKEIAIISMMILALADSFAAIVGKSFGKRMWFGKTIEGSIVFFVITFLIANFFSDNTGINVLGAALITFVELLSGRLSDNVTIPIISGVFFTLAKNF